MKLLAAFSFQFGLMISFGVNYENRLYFVLDMPFFWIQIIMFKIKKKNGTLHHQRALQNKQSLAKHS